MKKVQIAIVALLLGVAAILGTFAATRTASLGTASHHAADAAYAKRTKQLDAFSAKLRHELNAKPAAITAAPAAAPQGRVVYRRPPAIVVVKHTSHGDDGSERADGGGGND